MNIERLTRLAEWLEGGAMHHRINFDMNKGISIEEVPPTVEELSACGTSCCIAGAAVQFFDEDFDEWLRGMIAPTDDELEAVAGTETEVGWYSVLVKARRLLELSEKQAESLFEPHARHDRFTDRGDLAYYNDPDWAARVIRNLIATGAVDWEGTKEAR